MSEPLMDIRFRLRMGICDDKCRVRDAKSGCACAEAADRIEKLREELSIWKSVFPDIAPERVLPDRSLLEAENERLRAALREINVGEGWAALIARAALEGKG